jgi:hypothetical protein
MMMKVPSRWWPVLIPRRNVVVAAAVGVMTILAPMPGASAAPSAGCGCCCAHQSEAAGQDAARLVRRRRLGRLRQVHVQN